MAPRKKTKLTQVAAPSPTPSPPSVPIWKQRWLWVVGSVGALALLLTNINSILQNARALPGEVRKTSDQFYEWYGEYEAWRGHWTSNPEGLVDAAELNLSNEDFRLNIDETRGGSIVGWIETRGICDKVPVFQELLVDGSIASASRANVQVFGFIGGHRRPFASLALRRDGNVMTVIPEDDSSGIFAKETRIALDPDEMEVSESLGPLCAGKGAKFFTDLAKEVQQARSAHKAAE